MGRLKDLLDENEIDYSEDVFNTDDGIADLGSDPIVSQANIEKRNV